jgi:hypothetical protein
LSFIVVGAALSELPLETGLDFALEALALDVVDSPVACAIASPFRCDLLLQEVDDPVFRSLVMRLVNQAHDEQEHNERL